MRKLVNKLGLLFVLFDNFIKLEYEFDFRIQYVLYLLFIMFFLATSRMNRINVKSIVFLFFLVLLLTLIPLFKGTSYSAHIKQLLLIVYNAIFSFTLLNSYGFDLIRLIKDYVELIYLAAIVGFIQLISLIIGFRYGADFSYLGFSMGNFEMNGTRIQSWFEEPSIMVYAFTPVVFIGICRLFNLTNLISLPKTLFILTVFLLSQSSIAAAGLLLSFLIVIGSKYSILSKPHLIIGFLLLLGLFSSGLYLVPSIKIRVDDSIDLFLSDDVSSQDIDKVNISTYTLYSNYRVAKASFNDNPLVGTGIGTYELTYNKYLKTVVPASNLREQYQLNRKDANSLFLRIAAEMGLFGILLLVFFIVNYRARLRSGFQNKAILNYWIINHAMLILIILRLMRQGHYTMLGFTLFIMIYIYSKENIQQEQKKI